MTRNQLFQTVGGATLLLSGIAMAPSLSAADAPSAAQVGKELSFDNRKGNCVACHMIQGAESPGNIAPPLVAMQTRFPDKAKLREQIWDSTVRNPDTSMPPFGKHGILSAAELDQITEYIWSL